MVLVTRDKRLVLKALIALIQVWYSDPEKQGQPLQVVHLRWKPIFGLTPFSILPIYDSKIFRNSLYSSIVISSFARRIFKTWSGSSSEVAESNCSEGGDGDLSRCLYWARFLSRISSDCGTIPLFFRRYASQALALGVRATGAQ
jgi:hypothetical protein